MACGSRIVSTEPHLLGTNGGVDVSFARYLSCLTLVCECEPLFLFKVWIASTYVVLMYLLTYFTYLHSWYVALFLKEEL